MNFKQFKAAVEAADTDGRQTVKIIANEGDEFVVEHVYCDQVTGEFVVVAEGEGEVVSKPAKASLAGV